MKHRIQKQPRFRQSRVEPLEPRRLLAALDFTAHVATPGDVAPDLIYTEINRNERTDVLAMDVDERAIRWWEASDSRGRFSSTSTVLVEGVDQFIVSDMNRDGWIDLVTLSRLDGEVAIYWNLFRYENSHTGQHPTFSESPSVIIAQPGVIDFDLADFNRDGFRDLVLVTQQEGSNAISWMARDGVDSVGEIVWHIPVLIAEGRKLTYQTSIDFDVDAHNDLLAISETSVVWFRNSGNGKSFQRRTLLKDVQLDHDAPIALANMNGDGYPDIVAVTIEDSTRTVAWYRNESCGQDCYTQRTLRLGGIIATDRQAISAIAVTDIDGTTTMTSCSRRRTVRKSVGSKTRRETSKTNM